ncbi:MAG TPA: VWA domain-containing protein [Chitinophagaceae bacterium]|nr:VWA domain-containing protein [Chitinophagaceae bacterium]
MLHFRYTEYLVTLAAIPLIFLLYASLVRWKKRAAKKIGDPSLVRQLTWNFSKRKFSVKLILFITGFALCGFALATLVEPDGSQKITRKGIDIMIALDVSKSMLAEDIKPSRLDRAKQLISKLIDNLPGDKIGLVLFAGRAYLQMPMTIDHEAAKMYLSTASPEDVPTQGTVISDALKMCETAFNPAEKTYKTIILVSDGEDHDDDAIKIAKELGKEGIPVNTVGIGSPQGTIIMDPETGQYKKDDKGNTVITKLNEEELRSIAKNSGGLYQLYSTTNEVAGNIQSQLSGLGKEMATNDSSYISFRQYFQYFLMGALLLLVAEFFISEKRKRQAKAVAAIFLFAFLTSSADAQNVNKQIFKGNEAYKKNNFDAAENNYRNALKISPEDAIANFNLGNTLYRKDNADEAVQSYDNTIQSAHDNITKEKAYYNKGVAYQKDKKLPECINAYENALMLNPKDEDARQNLERALKQQRQQQNQQQNQKNNKQQPKQNQKKQQQQPQNQQQNNQPRPQSSKMTKQEAEEKLRSLLENEKELQDKLHRIKGAAAADKPEKDW